MSLISVRRRESLAASRGARPNTPCPPERSADEELPARTAARGIAPGWRAPSSQKCVSILPGGLDQWLEGGQNHARLAASGWRSNQPAVVRASPVFTGDGEESAGGGAPAQIPFPISAHFVDPWQARIFGGGLRMGPRVWRPRHAGCACLMWLRGGLPRLGG